MAMHVPFSQRPSGRRFQQPVYIGFETPRRKRKPKNWWGFFSVLTFLLSLGLLSPISLLMGLKGLGRKPRKAATVGTVLSLTGTAIMGLVIGLVVNEANQHQQRHELRKQQRIVAEQVADCEGLLAFAAEEFEGFCDENNGVLPADLDGKALAIKHMDPWGKELMFETKSDSAALRSAGPDGDYFTNDDVTHGIAGETGVQTLLPVGEDSTGNAEQVTSLVD